MGLYRGEATSQDFGQMQICIEKEKCQNVTSFLDTLLSGKGKV
jgi:hypothetical protein